MSLIICPECNAQVSERAANCIKCGCPIAMNAAPMPRASRQVQTIEKTGKKYKGQLVISFLLSIVGFFMMFYGNFGWGVGCTIVGCLWFFLAKIGMWWDHA